MAHFAQLDENSIVQRVIVVNDNNTSDSSGKELEEIGISFCKKLFGEDTIWVKCSRSGSIRNFMPGPGFYYHSELDVFCNPQPHPSWTLEGTTWTPPIVIPELSEEQQRLKYHYYWNETEYQRDSSTGWFIFTPQIVQIQQQPTNLSVSVSAGSSVEISSSVTISEGFVNASLITIVDTVDGVDLWNIPNNEVVGTLDAPTSTISFNTPILTSDDDGRQFKIKFAPMDSGASVETESVTITIV